MSYQNSLSPWVIYRHLPDSQRQFIERFRRRTHAEEYLKVIQRLSPHAEFELVYEINQPESHDSVLNCLKRSQISYRLTVKTDHGDKMETFTAILTNLLEIKILEEWILPKASICLCER